VLRAHRLRPLPWRIATPVGAHQDHARSPRQARPHAGVGQSGCDEHQRRGDEPPSGGDRIRRYVDLDAGGGGDAQDVFEQVRLVDDQQRPGPVGLWRPDSRRHCFLHRTLVRQRGPAHGDGPADAGGSTNSWPVGGEGSCGRTHADNVGVLRRATQCEVSYGFDQPRGGDADGWRLTRSGGTKADEFGTGRRCRERATMSGPCSDDGASADLGRQCPAFRRVSRKAGSVDALRSGRCATRPP
jgi:hypothetical protein